MDNNLLKQSFDTIMAPFTQSNNKQCSHQSHSFLHFKSNSNGKNDKNGSNRNKNSKTDTTNSPINETTIQQQNKNEISTTIANNVNKCIDNVHFNDLFQNTLTDSSSITMPQSIR